jgi:GLPGLI family protein
MKMKNFISTITLVILTIGLANAQYAFFPEQGSITYDKTVHVKNLMRRHIQTLKDGDFSKKYFEEMMSKVPETAVLTKKLNFNADAISVEPVEKDQPQMVSNLLRMGLLDYGAKLYQNFDKNESLLTMEMGGSQINIKDSLTNVKWKITNEYRNIAGYDCRRANGVTLDSVYVVAFYTDQIPTPGAPSTVHGLPGMILGLVVPEQHFNIYATKVEMTATTVDSNIFKKKADVYTRQQTKDRMKEIFGRWMTDKQFGLIMAAIFL